MTWKLNRRSSSSTKLKASCRPGTRATTRRRIRVRRKLLQAAACQPGPCLRPPPRSRSCPTMLSRRPDWRDADLVEQLLCFIITGPQLDGEIEHALLQAEARKIPAIAARRDAF